MKRFWQWVEDRRWAANMRRIRRFQRNLLFSKRELFFKALRPAVTMYHSQFVIAWPEAMMHLTKEDVERAMKVVNK